MTGIRRGTRLGKYRFERRLGSGGSADVWLGRDLVEGRRVAIKVINPRVVEEFGRDAIEHEARVAARLDHPNILSIRNADWIAPFFLIVTDVAQRSLENYITSRRSPALALAIIRDAAAGLAHAHSKHVLHCDIKPDNILIFPRRQAKLADFGTAHFAPAHSRLVTEVGTLGYMAPEQAYGRPHYASDVFSLALTAYQLVTGSLPTWPFAWPFEAHETFVRRVPEEIQRVLRRALYVPMSRRWPNGVAFFRAYERALRRAQQREQQPRTRRRRRGNTMTPPALYEQKWFVREYGTQLQLRFDCHQCGGPISEAMKFCPWCGSGRNSFIEVTSYPLVCPECERGVRPEWAYCPWCYAGRFEANGRQPPADKLAERRCTQRSCNGKIQPFMRYCPLCKTKILRPWSIPGLPPCRRCRGPFASQWNHCPWCGRRKNRNGTLEAASRKTG